MIQSTVSMRLIRWARVWCWVCVAPVILTGAGVALFHAHPSAFPGQTRLPGDGVYREVQASRGEDIFRTTCETCHGPTLEGSDPAPPLQGEAFVQAWDGEVLAELMTLMQETMPQDTLGKLTEENYTDLLAFVLSTNGFPPGEELTMDSMEEIVIAPED